MSVIHVENNETWLRFQIKHKNHFYRIEDKHEKYNYNRGGYLHEFLVEKICSAVPKIASIKAMVNKMYYIKLDTPVPQRHY